VTASDTTSASRVAGSLNHHLGLVALNADDDAAFVATAERLGHDSSARTALCAELTARRAVSPLFDRRGCAADIAVLLKRTAQRQRAGLAAGGIGSPGPWQADAGRQSTAIPHRLSAGDCPGPHFGAVLRFVMFAAGRGDGHAHAPHSAFCRRRQPAGQRRGLGRSGCEARRHDSTPGWIDGAHRSRTAPVGSGVFGGRRGVRQVARPVN